jgi:ribosomal protein L20
VRARDKESLENLAYKLSRIADVSPFYNGDHKFLNQNQANEYWLAKILETHDRDYPYRMYMLRETWAQYMSLYIENHNHINLAKREADLKYTNFKDACKDAGFDEAKLIVLGRIWADLAFDWDDASRWLEIVKEYGEGE